MMTVVRDGVEAHVVPECTRCKATGLHPWQMDRCPLNVCRHEDECDPDCINYEEDWEE